MPQLNIRSVEDFKNWCRWNSSKIMERFPQTDESIKFGDMEIGEIYILQNKGFMAKGRKWGHILYIIGKHLSLRDIREMPKYDYYIGRVDWEGDVADSWNIQMDNQFKGYYIIPVSLEDYYFINWLDNPFEVKS